MTVRLIRDVTRALRKELPGCVVVPLRQRVHHVFDITCDGRTRRLVVAVSPKSIEFAVLNAVKEAKRLMEEPCRT